MTTPDIVRRIIYWNLVWFYERVAVKSHLPALCFRAKSLFNDTPDTGDGEDADDRFAGIKGLLITHYDI